MQSPASEQKEIPPLSPSLLSPSPFLSPFLGCALLVSPPGAVWNGHLAFHWEHVSSFDLRYIAQLRGPAQTPLSHGKKLVQKEPVWPHRRFTALLSKYRTYLGLLAHSASEPQFPSILSFVREDLHPAGVHRVPLSPEDHAVVQATSSTSQSLTWWEMQTRGRWCTYPCEQRSIGGCLEQGLRVGLTLGTPPWVLIPGETLTQRYVRNK